MATPAPTTSLTLMSKLTGAVYTTYLFNQLDIVSTICPTIAVALVLAGPTDIVSFLLGFIWLELHLIAFEIKNQIVGLEEDRVAKPNRPIVSGRISISTAHKWYIFLIVLSLVQSYHHGILAPSIIHLVAMYAYNEGDMARFWYLKSFIGAIGYVCYCWGITVIYDNNQPLSQTSALAVVLSGLIFTTTGHAQDFRDRDGDAAVGRKTLAIMLPETFARWSLMGLIFTWTAGLVYIWAPPLVFCAVFYALAAITTVNFVLDYSQEADKSSYWWYNIWLIAAHVLPLFPRVGFEPSTLVSSLL